MIRISLNREPVTVPLSGAFTGCTVTLRRLTSNEFAEATSAAQARLRDSSKLVELLEEHGLRPKGRKIKALLGDVEFMLGIGQWLGAVECGVRAISGWTGFADETGAAIDPSRPVLEAVFLSKPFMDQVLPQIDAAAQLLAIEGKGSGVSPNGSPAHAPTASPLNTAVAVGPARSPARRASLDETENSARKPRTPRSRPKAPPSGT
jgi:hypothetical protein